MKTFVLNSPEHLFECAQYLNYSMYCSYMLQFAHIGAKPVTRMEYNSIYFDLDDMSKKELADHHDEIYDCLEKAGVEVNDYLNIPEEEWDLLDEDTHDLMTEYKTVVDLMFS